MSVIIHPVFSPHVLKNRATVTSDNSSIFTKKNSRAIEDVIIHVIHH